MVFKIRDSAHIAIEWLFEKSAYFSLVAIVLLSAISISGINKWVYDTAHFHIYYGNIIYYACLIVALGLGATSIERTKTVKNLEIELTTKKSQIVDLENSLTSQVNSMNELFNSYLILLVNNLKFSHRERISVYKVYENEFLLIGRSSTNPSLQKKHRTSYPINDGFIAKGWQEGKYFNNALCDPALKNGLDYYRQVNAIMPIPKEVISSMFMKSRTYMVYRINGFDGKPKAVFVAESLDPNAFTESNIISNLEGVKETLILFIERNDGVVTESNHVGL